MVVQGTTAAYADWLKNLMEAQENSLGSNFENFKKIHIPVSIIWGSEDTVTPLWQGQALQSLIPQSELLVIKGVGHIPYIENVSEFNSVLIKAIKK